MDLMGALVAWLVTMVLSGNVHCLFHPPVASDCLLQLGFQSLSEQVQAAASSSQQHQQAGSSKLDAAIRTLMQQESLQGKLHGRLPGLATVPAAQDEVAVNAVLKELCNLVSKSV